jgi:diguanylate cyclase (GGDEF)-like protein
VKRLFGSGPTEPPRPVKSKIVRADPDRHSVRAAAFNRFYVVLMFTMIFAIGGLGGYALVASQHSGDLVARVGDRANDAHRMTSALDREQVELLSSNRELVATRLRRFLAADRVFETALGLFEGHATIDDVPITLFLRPQHDAYVRNAHIVLAAIAHNDRHGAERIEAHEVRPRLEAIRRTLDAISAESFAASEREAVNHRRNVVALEWLIAAATALAIALMSGFAVLLRRYQRSAVKAAESQLAALEQAALTDNLTQLGNHRAFSDDFAREVARAKRNHHPLTLALIDVDDFKAVNDTRGHAHGDEVLALVGEQVRMLRQEDRAYRVGGDEFALLLVETSPAAAQTVLMRLKQKAQETLSGATLSIGYVNLTPDQLDREPYELADTALYEAKRRGRNNIVCFDDIGDDANVFSPRKAEQVRRLIKDGLLTIAFQPIWDIESAFPLAFEALARPAPELGLTGPQEAFDIAERIRQEYELDSVCIGKALEAASNLPSGSTIFLNVAPASLAHPDFDPNAFVASVQAAGLRPDHVVIELTERRIENTAIIIQRARVLRSLGVRMALDDTGSGHAGLEILSKLSVDFVKIDRSLLVQAIDDRSARGVLAGIIAIARETGSYLIAEGIENVELLDFACDAHGAREAAFPGIRGMQGYLLGRPEVGRVDLRALELHHAYLEARRSPADSDVARTKAA